MNKNATCMNLVIWVNNYIVYSYVILVYNLLNCFPYENCSHWQKYFPKRSPPKAPFVKISKVTKRHTSSDWEEIELFYDTQRYSEYDLCPAKKFLKKSKH